MIDRGQQQQQHHQQETYENEWVAPFECCMLCSDKIDQEACWWSTWCPCLVEARTIDSFGLVPSKETLKLWFISMFFVGISLFLGLLPVALVAFLVFWNSKMTRTRTTIRQLRRIKGTESRDFYAHCCKGRSAIMQEATEAVAARAAKIDFCSGEDLASIAKYTSENDLAISKTSKLVLWLSAAVGILDIIGIYHSDKPWNVCILALVFLQPAVILYFVYWRSRRQAATLDSVIKMFAVGFWLTTLQAIVLESLLQLIGLLLLAPFGPANLASSVIFSTDDDNDDDNENNNNSSGSGSEFESGSGPGSSSLRLAVRTLYRLTKPLESFLWSQIQSQSQSKFPTTEFNNGIHAMGGGDENEEMPASQDEQHALLVKYTFFFVVVLFLMAFAMAAGVEETVKHFAVQCCRFPLPLAHPNTVLVYMATAALGFSTSENIGYVFGASMHGVDTYTAEVVTLAARVLLPVHFLCSVLQAAELSYVAINVKQQSLFWTLWPALLLHGTFDYVLFLGAFFSVAYDLKSDAYQIAFMVIPVAITIVGACVARSRFNKVMVIADSMPQGHETSFGAIPMDLEMSPISPPSPSPSAIGTTTWNGVRNPLNSSGQAYTRAAIDDDEDASRPGVSV